MGFWSTISEALLDSMTDEECEEYFEEIRQKKIDEYFEKNGCYPNVIDKDTGDPIDILDYDDDDW